MGVQVLNKAGLLLILLSLGFFGKKEKVVVPRIQRAVVIENQAIIYTQPDFDAEQIVRLPSNRIIAISTKIYRPKNLFGSFYRIFINKPRKIRGYISEIDVLPQYKKTKDGYVLNKEYAQKEQALKQVKTQLIQIEKKAVQPESNLTDEPEASLQAPQEAEDLKETQSSKNEMKNQVSEPPKDSVQEKKLSEEKKESEKPAEESIQKKELSEEKTTTTEEPKNSENVDESSKENQALEKEDAK